MIGNAGGAGVLASDAAQSAGLEVPILSEALRQRLPGPRGQDNPIDLGAGATARDLSAALEEVAGSGEVDAVVAVVAATRANDPDAMLDVVARSVLPTVAVVLGRPDSAPLLDEKGARPVPVYQFPESAVRALGHAVRYGRWRRSSRGVVPDLAGIRAAEARGVVARALAGRPEGGWLPAETARELLATYGIEMVSLRRATDAVGAVEAARSIGYPVVLKTADPAVVHKSDVGGVALNLGDDDEVRTAFERVAEVGDGSVLVEPMLAGQVELLVGVVQEPTFGPVLVLGMGGVWTEVLGDQAFRILPLTDVDAAAMVRDLRCSPLLFGYRGSPRCDVDALSDLLLRVARLADDVPEVAELDLNPVMASRTGAVATDVRLRLAPTPEGPLPELRRLR
ncbi:MAG: acetate--CoA ligase family protein [Actinomycetes bacterium]